MDLEELKIIPLCPWRILQESNTAIDKTDNTIDVVKTTMFLECYGKRCPFWQPGKFGYYCARAGGI